MSDVAAFNVYRGEDGGGPPERLTDTPVTDRFFLDTTRDPARTYRYTVTAMDTADPPNESPPSFTPRHRRPPRNRILFRERL